jgi:hypothetical protein
MGFYATHYRSGEEIRPGDRILWAGSPGAVLFVIGRPGVPAEWGSPEEWLAPEGFMLETESAGLVFEDESDEDLEFLEREP